MSDESTSVVCLDARDVDEVARRATAFLSAELVISPNLRRDESRQPSEWVPGPAADSVLDQPVGLTFWRDLAGNGVDVDLERALHYAAENYEAPRCSSCGRAMAEDTYFELLERWLDSQEPTVKCTACGAGALLGDWSSEWPSAVGCPAIVFHNWPPLSSAFLARLQAVLGGRTVVVRGHF